MLSWHCFLLGRRAEPELGAVPDMTGQGFGFNNIVAFSMGENKERPSIGDVVILLESCSMGMTVRSDKRVRVTGAAFLKNVYNGNRGGVDLYYVPTDDGQELYLGDLRRWKGVDRTWAHVT